MRMGFRERMGVWLERFSWLAPLLLRYDGIAPAGRRRYVNRISRHVVLR